MGDHVYAIYLTTASGRSENIRDRLHTELGRGVFTGKLVDVQRASLTATDEWADDEADLRVILYDEEYRPSVDISVLSQHRLVDDITAVEETRASADLSQYE